MPVIPVTTLADPRLAPYRALKDRELARDGQRFIAEGEMVVGRLLASDYPVESVLLSTRRADEVAPTIRADVPVLVAPDEFVHRIIGFKFHSGMIACGRRKPATALDDVLGAPRAESSSHPLTLVILPETANAENMGSMIRLCAAFGVDALVLGELSCDPFWRQSIRVSMGTIFSLPIVRSDDLMRDLRRLQSEHRVELCATVLDATAQDLKSFHRPARLGILFGNEAQGLDARYVDACDHRITIPMRRGTDSLNVAVAAGIFLHHLTA